MMISFQNKSLRCRTMEVTPGRLKPGDLIQLPTGLLQIETVQTGCPFWENSRKSFTNVLARTESNLPIELPRNLPAHVRILRPKR